MLTPVPGCAWGRDRSSGVADVDEPAWVSRPVLPAVTSCRDVDLVHERWGDEQRSLLMPPQGSGDALRKAG